MYVLQTERPVQEAMTWRAGRTGRSRCVVIQADRANFCMKWLRDTPDEGQAAATAR